uniref:Uncharacterized protein n=1 Tax=Mycena chlorophos TaxID=658473 RepID=A0ABQ0KVQ2_MYCCL|nr:predicted protein [Mycena chlorophos]
MFRAFSAASEATERAGRGLEMRYHRQVSMSSGHEFLPPSTTMPKRKRSEKQQAQTQRLKMSRHTTDASPNRRPLRNRDENRPSSPLSDVSDDDASDDEAEREHALQHQKTIASLERAQKRLKDVREENERLEMDLRAAKERITRLERDGGGAYKKSVAAELKHLADTISDLTAENEQLREQAAVDSHSHSTQLEERDAIITLWRTRSRTHYSTLDNVKQQLKRAQEARDKYKKLYDEIAIWKTKCEGAFTARARWLFRQLVAVCGCAEDRVDYAMVSFARATGITVSDVPSARTVGRAILEGGELALMHLGYNIMNSPALGDSTDGTTHRGITVESRHLTLKVKPLDGSGPAKWTTRFLGVERARNHTGEQQHIGMTSVVRELTTGYSASPMAKRLGHHLTFEEVAEDIRSKAEETRAHQAAVAEANRLELARLAGVGLVLDREELQGMVMEQLRDQLRIFKKILNEPELEKTTIWGHRKEALQKIVFAAAERYKSRVPSNEPSPEVERQLEGAENQQTVTE